MGKKRFIWEEILEVPAVYRICEAGSRENTYLIMSGGESMVVDPRSEEMMRSIQRLSGGLGAPAVKMQVFLTQGCTNAAMWNIIRSLSPGTVIYTLLSGELEGEKREDHHARVVEVTDGSRICLGSIFFQCIRLEGHARGLAGLWLSEEGILFSGDAVGCDYLPDVPEWDSRIDTLGLHIESLRRIEHLPVRLILPGQGMPAGLEEEGDGDSRRISNVCALVLENMIGQYCIRLLEVYQQIPSRGSISLEQLEMNEWEKASGKTGSEKEYRKDPGETEHPDAPDQDPGSGNLSASCRKYLLYRKYIRQKEDEKGQTVFEKGSVLLTDWSIRER